MRLALAPLVLLSACGAVQRGAGGTDAFAVMAALDALAVKDLWPGFDPRAAPVAIFDGESTWLFRHPAAPAGFVPERGALRHRGQHDAVRANAWATIGGVAVATVLLDRTADATAAAGTLVHEAFHVFQDGRHPGWRANELDLFTVPFDDAEVLVLRRAEALALSRALDGADDPCWARAAVATRGKRFVRIASSASRYERDVERHEGLAQYVERRAIRRPPAGFTPAELPVEKLRERAYASGEAWATLLDRFAPGWRDAVAGGDDAPLDELLARAVGVEERCHVTNEELEALRAVASAETAALLARREERRRALEQREGWTVVVVAAREPLWPKGFDPLNITPVGDEALVHERWLVLENGAGKLEVLGRDALSEGAGDHPLAEGVGRLTVTGLVEPTVSEGGGKVHVAAPGLKVELSATVAREGRRVELRLP
jgi:hypothetical protein